MPRRTKIVATLGPATDSKQVLTDIIIAGVDVVRINCSHGSIPDLEQRINLVRAVSKELNLETAILLDLQGPKIRINSFKTGSVVLKVGQEFILDAELSPGDGDEMQVGIDYKELPQDVKSGDILLLDDGRLSLRINQVKGNKIVTTVVGGGALSNKKGINLLGGGLSAEALTSKDKEDIKLAGRMQIDYVAISFPRSKEDILYARELLKKLIVMQGLLLKLNVQKL